MDKSKIIENPKFIGCLNCSPTPATILNENKPLYEMVFISHDKKEIYSNTDCFVTWKELKQKYGKKIKDGAKMDVISALHDETYTYDEESGNWYLTKQGMGYA